MKIEDSKGEEAKEKREGNRKGMLGRKGEKG